MNAIVPEKRDHLNHVLFLDFDGPLFSDRYINHCSENSLPYPGEIEMYPLVHYWKMDPLAVEMLNSLHDLFPFTTVVSSSWKRFSSKEFVTELFEVNGLRLNLADDWCTVRLDTSAWRNCVRAFEIAEYIERHGVKEYVILDDPGSGLSLDGDDHGLHKHRIVMVNPDLGIGSHDFKEMLTVVKQWAGVVPPLW